MPPTPSIARDGRAGMAEFNVSRGLTLSIANSKVPFRMLADGMGGSLDCGCDPGVRMFLQQGDRVLGGQWSQQSHPQSGLFPGAGVAEETDLLCRETFLDTQRD